MRSVKIFLVCFYYHQQMCVKVVIIVGTDYLFSFWRIRKGEKDWITFLQLYSTLRFSVFTLCCHLRFIIYFSLCLSSSHVIFTSFREHIFIMRTTRNIFLSSCNYCGITQILHLHIHVNKIQGNTYRNFDFDELSKRIRASPVKNTCNLIVWADTKFHMCTNHCMPLVRGTVGCREKF